MTPLGLTALGMVNALGDSLSTISTNIFHSRDSKLSEVTLKTTGEKVLAGRALTPLPDFPEELLEYSCRNHALAYSAFLQIKNDVSRVIEKYGAERVGTVLGSSTSGLDASETAVFSWLNTGELPSDYNFLTQHQMGGVSEFIARLSKTKGPFFTVSTACSTSAKAFASASNLIHLNICDAVIVGGVDTLCHLTLNGFRALELLSNGVSNPFSLNRDGLNIGEGAALFVLERSPGIINLCGIGESCDAYHVSAPDPTGGGAIASMEDALEGASLTPDEIGYLNLHGTGTPLNDMMEAKAVDTLFNGVPCSSVKPLIGHCLGAAGAMETGVCWLMLNTEGSKRLMPTHRWDGVTDPDLPQLKLVHEGEALPIRKSTYAMSNSFAFGGSNCSAILGRYG